MNNEKIRLSKTDNYWIYVLSSTNVQEFWGYDEPFFVIPDDDSIEIKDFKKGDIIIFLLTKKGGHCFIGFVQLNSKAIKNVKGKVKIFKDSQLNTYYVPLCFKMLCDNTKLSVVFGALNFEDYDKGKFTKTHIKKCIVITPIAREYGKAIVKYVINANCEDINVQSDTTPMLTSTDEDEDDEEVSGPMIPIMVKPCKKYNILEEEDQIKYFVDHYKECRKCSCTNNNNIELGSVIIGGCNYEYYEIKEEKHAYFDPALTSYFADEKYEPIDGLERPFVRIMYVNNNHDLYQDHLFVCWAI